jgi:cyanophycinase
VKIVNGIRIVVLVAILIPAAAFGGDAGSPKGSLFIIGGGDRPVALMKEFVELAGGAAKASIVVIPNASGDPDTACLDMVNEFHALGARSVTCLCPTREQSLDPRTAERLNGATGVYFTGGDQVRVTSAMGGTPLHQKLLQVYRDGAVIGGTSAGAALMSKVMITGDELLNKDTVRNFVFIKKDNVVAIEGMGFLDKLIIDQHFVARKRHNRLISLVLEHPHLVGVGIDEATAIVVSRGETFRVVGNSSVIVYDATKASGIRTSPTGYLSGHNLTMHVLTAGDAYDIARRTVISGGEEH